MLQLQIYRSLNKINNIVPLPISGNSIYANSVEADAYIPVFCSRCNTEWLLPIHIGFKGDPKKEYKCPRCYIEEKLKNAKKTTWPADGIPKWRVFLWIHSAKLKVKLWRMWRRVIRK